MHEVQAEQISEKITIGLYAAVEGEASWDMLIASQIVNIRKIHEGVCKCS